MTKGMPKKRRHYACLCGTGRYCHFHLRYGELLSVRDFTHYVPSDRAVRAGGGVRVLKKQIGGT